MQRRTKRATARLMAFAFLAAAVDAGASCSLDSTGLGPALVESDGSGDAGVLVPSPDAMTFVPPGDGGIDAAAHDSDPDAATPDGAPSCASIESDCLDGLDDDCNGLTDCADPACSAGYVCVPAAASGWSGYALYDDGRTTACPDPYATQTDTYEGLLSTPATCSACACTAGGATCGVSSLSCGVACLGSTATLDATCDDFTAPMALDGTSGCSASIPAATAGSCASSGGTATLAPVGFSKQSRTCGSTRGPGGGCAATQACVARAPSGSHGVCVSQSATGTTLCPAGYPHAYVVMPDATSFRDTRACTACACGAPVGATCAATVTLDPRADCTEAGGDDAGGDDAGAPISFAADGLCHGLLVSTPTSFASGSLQTTVTSQGACSPPSGGAPTGSVTPTNQTAYCCQD